MAANDPNNLGPPDPVKPRRRRRGSGLSPADEARLVPGAPPDRPRGRSPRDLPPPTDPDARLRRGPNPPVPQDVADNFTDPAGFDPTPNYSDFVKKHGGRSNAYLGAMWQARFGTGGDLNWNDKMRSAVEDVAKRRKKAGLPLGTLHREYTE